MKVSSTKRAGCESRIIHRSVFPSSGHATRWGTYAPSPSSTSSSSGRTADTASDLYLSPLFYHEKTSRKEFCGATKCSLPMGHDKLDLERLLKVLDVGWVLCVADDDSDAGTTHQLRRLTATWLRALAEITQTYSYFVTGAANNPDGQQFFCILDQRYWVQGSIPDELVFAPFACAAISNMLPFVDSLVAPPRPTTVDGALPAEKLQALLQVRGAIFRIRSMAELYASASSSSSAKVRTTGIHNDLFSLLSAKLATLDEAVWQTMEDVRARVMSSTHQDDGGNSSSCLPQSADIHRTTRSILSYIYLLETNYGSVHRIIYEAAKLRKHVPAIGNISTLASLKLEMVSCLEEKLDKESQSCPDQGLRFLFLINNLNFVRQQFHQMFHMKFHMPVLTCKIEDYIQKYLQVSWAPVLSCLHSPTPSPLCFGRTSQLPRFASEFQKTYSTQKHWKVPDPELRRMLRKAISENVTSSYTEYLEGNTLSTQAITLTALELEEMLQELFEG